MKRLFADTVYWIALTNSFDQYHSKAVEVSSALGNCRLFTTDAVLTEFLNALKGEMEDGSRSEVRGFRNFEPKPSLSASNSELRILQAFSLQRMNKTG